ncbi:MAG: hypothetical protein U0M28_01115, partial [Bacteroidales bacterium]|nr:hypothetical protein [Bacteroidales bacterium]
WIDRLTWRNRAAIRAKPLAKNLSKIFLVQNSVRERAERQVSVCREISKIHEESVRGSLSEVIAHFTANEPRGEIVIVLSGKED